MLWWQGRSGANAPRRAVERFTAQMSSVDLQLFDGDHRAGYRHEEILADSSSTPACSLGRAREPGDFAGVSPVTRS